MAVWPATLPAPALNTLTETPPDNLIRSNVDRGPAKIRRRTTANVRPIAFELNLTPAQVAVLDTFYIDTLYSGADSFTYTHPRTSVTLTARFAERPQYTEREGTDYRASISLEILP